MSLVVQYLALTGRDCPECAAHRKEFIKTLPVPSAACTAHHFATQDLEDAFLKRLEDLERQLAIQGELILRLKRAAVSKSQTQFSDEYRRHLASASWKAFRVAAIEACGRRCQRCATSKPYAVRPRGADDSLHVHHLHYETLGREQLEDVLVLCPGCHELADATRKAASSTEDHLARGLAALVAK